MHAFSFIHLFQNKRQTYLVSNNKTVFLVNTPLEITMSSDDNLTGTPPEVRQMAQNVSAQLLPEKSRARYEAQFNVFMK
jgi:hypothetical protein